jgi:hypothetical protein
VTPKAEFPCRVDGKILFVIRVIYSRPMAILALDRLVGRSIQLRHVFFMTFNAELSSPVLDGEIFPFLNVAQAVIAIGEVPAVNSEVIGNQKLSGYKYQTDQADRYPQRAQYIPLHRRLRFLSNR